MKKTVALVVSGSLLLGSAVYSFGLEGVNNEGEMQEDPIVITVNLEDIEEAAEVNLDIINELIGEIKDLDLNEEELDELIDQILEELEKALDQEENSKDVADDEDEVEDDLENEDALENLYRNLVKYQAVYDQVPDVAKPAIMKNIRKMQLKILSYQVKSTDEFLQDFSIEELEALQEKIETLQEELLNQDLTDEEKEELQQQIEELEGKIKQGKETNAFIQLIETDGKWQQLLRRQIQQEFLAEKKEQIQINKEEKLAIKSEIKEAREAIKQNKKEDSVNEKEKEETSEDKDQSENKVSVTVTVEEKATKGNNTNKDNGNGNNAGNQAKGKKDKN
ncbi:hypothetical protein SAMN05446037_101110 [Anaerovirgula multivorans]|uniref:DUF5667 domain-containing protein n=1 Tax=Anaerovirgula multivorans TaxID=312168 RepID=A0A239ET54_9FIRM|nr:hypothetical protein [Anaerovirgula multivorans]SNS47591.1 hypothetical protein SAMN05446037_101110 [Anaerovirgula multivorans]